MKKHGLSFSLSQLSTFSKITSTKQVDMKPIIINEQREFDFGHFPQGPQGQIKPITWVVLEKYPAKLLAISKYCLDSMAFDDFTNNWENADLNYWLNNDFLYRAFSQPEQQYLSAPITLLTMSQIRQYFKTDKKKIAHPTAYLSQKLRQPLHGPCQWWLQTPGTLEEFAAIIATDGGIYNDGIHIMSEETTVRPVLCLNAA